MSVGQSLASPGPSAQLPAALGLSCVGGGTGEVMVSVLGSTRSTVGCSAPARFICKEAAGGIKEWPRFQGNGVGEVEIRVGSWPGRQVGSRGVGLG